MKEWLKVLSICCLMALAACNSGGNSKSRVLATFGDQQISLQDMDEFLLSLPEENRWAAPGTDPNVWLEDNLRRLAVERRLANSPALAQLKEEPATLARREWMRLQALNRAIGEQILADIQPTEAEVDAYLATLPAIKGSETILDFQHIFFRTDRGDAEAKRKIAREVTERAQKGEDFPNLARTYSDSANAKDGGLVRNVNPSQLDETSRGILLALEEGSVSDLVESRTGLHLFRLTRRVQTDPPKEEQRRAMAAGQVQQKQFEAAYRALREDLRQSIEIDTDDEAWQIGRVAISKAMREPHRELMASPPNTDQIIDTALMAHAALERELETETLTARLDRLFELECLQRILNRRYEELPNLLPPERIRPFYEAQTALFATPEEFHIGLIFVPHGRDSFETQKRLEKRVADLRAGASFEDAARELSTGPKASEGGDLGWMGAKDYYRLGPSVSNVVSTLKVGDISEPIYCTDRVLTRDPMMLRGGFAILRIHDHKPAVERSFEEAIDQVRAAYLAQNRTELEREIRDKILARANFQIKHLPDPTEFLP